jgi:hypothetical protein
MHLEYFEGKKTEILYLLAQSVFFRSARGHLYHSAFPNILRENIVESSEGEEGDTVGVLSRTEPCGSGARSWYPLPYKKGERRSVEHATVEDEVKAE